jgi:hypothetical protein
MAPSGFGAAGGGRRRPADDAATSACRARPTLEGIDAMFSVSSRPAPLCTGTGSLEPGGLAQQAGGRTSSQAAVAALAVMFSAMAQLLKGMADNGGMGNMSGAAGAGMPLPAAQPPAPVQPAAPAQQGAPVQSTAPGAPGKVAKNEKDCSVKPSADDKRPPGDHRSAQQIIDDNPVLKNLGNQKDIGRENLKKQCGDFEHDPDAAYRAAHVLNYIDNSGTAKGAHRDNAGDGDIQGLTKSGQARHGTEAGMVKDFGEKGYDSLPAADANWLPKTKDKKVNEDGSTKSDFKAAMAAAGHALFFIPGLSNVLTGFGNSKDGQELKGIFKDGLVKTWKNDAEGALDSLKSGKGGSAGMLMGMYTKNIENNDQSPEWAKQAAGAAGGGLLGALGGGGAGPLGGLGAGGVDALGGPGAAPTAATSPVPPTSIEGPDEALPG